MMRKQKLVLKIAACKHELRERLVMYPPCSRGLLWGLSERMLEELLVDHRKDIAEVRRKGFLGRCKHNGRYVTNSGQSAPKKEERQ